MARGRGKKWGGTEAAWEDRSVEERWQEGMTGQDLRELRKTLRWSQRQMAYELGLKTEDSVYKKERGLRRITQRDVEILIAKGLLDKRHGLQW